VNPSTALATVLVDELVRGGVREAVLAPGSRSAPLALALHAADAAGRLRLHVRIDERSAAFLALGLAKASGVPVPVVTTSGTAVLNLHPAVVEASEAGVPLLLLTPTGRPSCAARAPTRPSTRSRPFGASVRWFVEVGAPTERVGEVAYWRSMTCQALAAALHDPGPVHLNVALREPLVPDGSSGWVEPLDGRPDGRPWTAVVPAGLPERPVDDLPARTVVVLGTAGTPSLRRSWRGRAAGPWSPSRRRARGPARRWSRCRRSSSAATSRRPSACWSWAAPR
jgi:2-succinyl-5-enolpyruvyl-6-hydroxy-3-cyclohexene-1-carboxylate synthase